MGKMHIEELWNKILNTAEWAEFNNYLIHLKEGIEHMYDFCENNGYPDDDLDDQEVLLNQIHRSIDRISKNVKKFHIE